MKEIEKKQKWRKDDEDWMIINVEGGWPWWDNRDEGEGCDKGGDSGNRKGWEP